MANTKISQLASAVALVGTEEVPVVQDGATVKTTVQDIANLAGGGASTLEILSDGTVTLNASSVRYSTGGIVRTVSGNQSVQIATFPELYLSQGNGTYITFPTLTGAAISMGSHSSLTTISFPALTSIFTTGMSAFSITTCSLLNTINIPVLTSLPDNSYFQFVSNALSQSCVDDILVKFAATVAINGNLQLNGGTNASPSATGLAAVTTLQGRGWTVTTN